MNMQSQQPRMTQAERTDLSDARMLEAAVELIVERGTDKTTLKEVGERAGYSRGLAGYRFGSKAGLFEFIVRTIGEYWLKELTRVTQGRSGFDALAAAIDEHLRFCTEAPNRLRAFYMLWFDSIGPDSGVRAVVSGIHARRRRDVATWLAEAGGQSGLSADDIAGQFSAALIGIVYHWLQQPDDLDEIARLHHNLKQTMRLALGQGAQR